MWFTRINKQKILVVLWWCEILVGLNYQPNFSQKSGVKWWCELVGGVELNYMEESYEHLWSCTC